MGPHQTECYKKNKPPKVFNSSPSYGDGWSYITLRWTKQSSEQTCLLQGDPQPAQQGIGAAASRQKRGRQDDSSGGDARDDGGDDDGGDDDGGEARGGDAAMEGGEASGGSVATTGDDGGDGGDGGAAAAPKKKKKKQSPAGRKRGHGTGDQRNVRHRAAADDSGA